MDLEKILKDFRTWGLLTIIFFILSIIGADSDWTVLTAFLVLACLGMTIARAAIAAKKDKEEIMDKVVGELEEVIEVENLEVDRYYISADYKAVIIIDETNQKICFIENTVKGIDKFKNTSKDFNYDYTLYKFNDLLETEILQDGETVTKTSRGSQIGGALLGGVLAGGVGAIIGGLSGSTTSDEEFSKITLKVLMNDTQNPVKLIYFLDEIANVKKYDDRYKKANADSMDWHGVLRVIIQQVDKEDKKKYEQHKEVIVNQTEHFSIADELKKLSDLHKEGILSEEEFNEHKKKILSM
ncbi:SHOCT domain-containing protein [Priestia megaterium]|uniref:SHOCT domain-containing protein n=1 Tax=Priestia megaterium TaxID=1404 RepID=UPI002B2521B4|nr:SHOCT domain-containing protein [Priestia megaterium]MEB2264159.1 SHOCT domain-containing protein [Priestia megaterium]